MKILTLLTIADRTSREKCVRIEETWTSLTTWRIDIYRVRVRATYALSTVAAYTFFSSAHRTFQDIPNVGHKTSSHSLKGLKSYDVFYSSDPKRVRVGQWEGLGGCGISSRQQMLRSRHEGREKRRILKDSSAIGWCKELTHWRRPWCWRRLKAKGEGAGRGWDGWIASSTQWTWMRANSRRQWRTGKPGVLQSMGLQRVGHDLATEYHHHHPCHRTDRSVCISN